LLLFGFPHFPFPLPSPAAACVAMNFRSKYLRELGIPVRQRPPSSGDDAGVALPGSFERHGGGGDVSGLTQRSRSPRTSSEEDSSDSDVEKHAQRHHGRRRHRARSMGTDRWARPVEHNETVPRAVGRAVPKGGQQSRQHARTLGASGDASSGLAAALAMMSGPSHHDEFGVGSNTSTVGVGMFAADEDGSFHASSTSTFGTSFGRDASASFADGFERHQGFGLPRDEPALLAHEGASSLQAVFQETPNTHGTPSTPGTLSSTEKLMGGITTGIANTQLSSSNTSTSSENLVSLGLGGSSLSSQGGGAVAPLPSSHDQSLPAPVTRVDFSTVEEMPPTGSDDRPLGAFTPSHGMLGGALMAGASGGDVDVFADEPFAAEDEAIDFAAGQFTESHASEVDFEGKSRGAHQPSVKRRPFIPPHVLAAQERQRQGYEVGSGQSLANFNRQQARHYNQQW
jgi:hypothetical protein